MFPILLIIIYSSLVCFWISKAGYFKIKELSSPFICGVFLLKILVGMLYGYIHQNYFEGSDTFDYFRASSQIANTFFSYPSYYFQSWLGMSPSLPIGADVFTYPEWKFIQRDFGTYLLVHLHAIPQLISFGSYNVHIVFVAIIGLVASVNLYKALKETLFIPNPLLIFTCFFMPSVLFWTAGLHKDVWVYLGLSFVLLGLSGIRTKQAAIIHLFLGLLIVSVFRYYLLIVIFPPLLAYLWSVFSPSKLQPIYKFSIVYAGLIALVVLVELSGQYSVLTILSDRQQAFLSEMGGSSIDGISRWDASFWGIISFLPHAIINVCFRPFLWDCHDVLQILAALEVLAFWAIALLSLPFRRVASVPKPMSYFLFYYAVGNLLLIGLLVGNVGTIVRYRAIALAFLAIVILQAFDFIRIGWMQRQAVGFNKGLPGTTPNKKLGAGKEKVHILP